jgi:type II secretory ATPase GspE/PulE/Tfp pilus assembly ATPase PilB-like protein
MTMPAPIPTDAWILATLEGLLTPEQFAEMRSVQGESFWGLSVRRGWTTDDQILTALSHRFRLPIANLSVVQPRAVDAVPEQLARRYGIVPMAMSDATLDIATANPYDLDCERLLAFVVGRTIRMSLAAPGRLAERLEELYRPETVIETLLDEGFTGVGDLAPVDGPAADEFALSLGKATEQPIIRLVDRIIAKAIQHRSSDIHLEPEEQGVLVRYRIDGVLTDDSVIPRVLGIPLVARIKIMAQLDIADRLRPQDGRARVSVHGARIDLRISTLPASLGEKVVVRILDARSTVMSVEGMGLNPAEADRIHRVLAAREGLILVTGPTGSGKTTTLYSMLRTIQQRGVNIVTVEDPVEYRLQGIVQVSVNEKTGLTFPTALRSILRQDPDVILVGEVRDRETALIATQASLTGHLVLTTLHTIDAASSITRLTDLGIDPYKTAAALKGVLAQRLVRRLCPQCKQRAVDPVPERLATSFPPGTTLYRATGCGACSGTGYRGRLALLEILTTTREVERRIAARESPDRIADAAREAGMQSLWESGVQHVRAGRTTLDELLRVLAIPSDDHRASSGLSVTAVPPPRRDAGAPARRGTLHGAPTAPVVDPTPFELLTEDRIVPDAGVARSVLVVEGDDASRRVLRDLLERSGFVVYDAADGAQALDEVDRAAPDLVVLDLNLPRLDGYGVLRQLRSRPATRDLPIIVLTAQGDEETEVRVFESGATDFMTKPYRPRALIARLHARLQRP